MKIRWIFSLALITWVLSVAVNSQAATEEWVAKYSAAGNGNSYATDVATDNAGNVYVTGYSAAGSPNGWEIVTIKYDASGTALWASPAVYNGPVTNGADIGNAIAVDLAGNVFVTGSSAQGVTGDDVITLKYSSAGVLLWDSTYTSAGNADDVGWDIAVSSSGDAYVTGRSDGDFLTIKYTNGGGRWATALDGGSDDGGNAIVYSSGGLYAAGYMQRTGVRKDYWTAKYNTATGDTLWTRTYKRPVNSGGNIAHDITTD
jgi:hypothetical protein